MALFPVLVDVYHKEKLLTKEEAKRITSLEPWKKCWVEVAVNKDDVSTKRIADILIQYGFNDYAQCIRGKFVYSRLIVL